MTSQRLISMRTLVDGDTPPTPPPVTVDDLPDLHEQLLTMSDRGHYVIDAARIVAQLHDKLIDFPNSDPRLASWVLHEVVLGLRRGPLDWQEDSNRYDLARGWLDNIWMRYREWTTGQQHTRG